ncbi:hypothetical protein EDF33_1011119 [Curtobacterium sp. PhB146]|nr:hypothetical protein EDF33_1011119 [Curtobacterium sp. PhB146]
MFADPTRAPTETRATVLAETTRIPARRTGPANGSSTVQKRPHAEYPTEVAESTTSAGTAANASAANRTMMATAYTDSPTTMFTGSVMRVPSR